MPSKKEKQPLSVTHPELAKEADGWDPTNYTAGSNLKRGWLCESGHKWEAVIASRASLKRGCPICSNKKILAGFNDLKSLFPEIALSAHGWDPSSVGAGSGKNYSWICEIGHTWTARVVDRTTKNYGCPTCSGKKTQADFNDLQTTNPSLAKEADGWDPTSFTSGSNRKMKWKCRLNHQWSAVISDRSNGQGCPVCSGNKVLAGFNDLETTHPQIAKQAFGWNPSEFSRGSHKKLNWKCSFGHIFTAVIKDRVFDSSGCPVCSNHQLLIGFNDLLTTHPELSKECYEWDPKTVVSGSIKKMKWRCNLKHIWEASPASRTRISTGCPICLNLEVLVGFNDLRTTHPLIASEALGWDTTKVVAGSGEQRKWKCQKGHIWETRVSHRTSSGSNCPSCALTGYDPNQSGFLYFLSHPTWEMFQIGITNNPDKRLGQHKKLGWEVLQIRGPMDGHLTQQWETAILRMLKAKGADLSNSEIAGKFDGYSEAWSKSTFEAKSIKELMRLTEEFEAK